MLKKVMRTIVTTAICTMLLASTAFAARESFYFYLSDTGTEISSFSTSRNTKVNINDPWTLKITSISCSGLYGIRFAPAKVVGSSVTACKQSAVWRNTTGYGLVKFASGDNELITYALAARQDDDYPNSHFYAQGWWNADAVKDN